MISTDRAIFIPDSPVRKRMAAYGKLADEVHVVVFSKSSHRLEECALAPNVRAYPTASYGKWSYIPNAIRIGARIARAAMRRGGHALITCQDPFETGLAGWIISRMAGAALHLQLHTDAFSPYFARASFLNTVRVWIARFLLPRAHGVRVVSQRVADGIARTHVPLRQPAIVLPVYRPRMAFTTAGENMRAQYPQFEKIILIVSRLEREKHIPLALRVFQKVAAKVPKAGLFIVGDGSLRKHLEGLAREYDMAERVVFFGAQHNIVPFYASADMLLLTSLYEGYGLVLAEAAEMGIPAVSTDVGIAPELFGGVASLVCAAGDEECLVKNTLAILSDARFAARVSVSAKDRLATIESWRTEEEYMARMRESWEATLRARTEK